jgi:hypothetical protein
MEKIYMDSLVSVQATVEKLGFKRQPEVKGKSLVSLKTKYHFLPDQVEIVHFYRFEDESNPDDSAVLYAIQTIGNEKSTSPDSETATFMLKVKKKTLNKINETFTLNNLHHFYRCSNYHTA